MQVLLTRKLLSNETVNTNPSRKFALGGILLVTCLCTVGLYYYYFIYDGGYVNYNDIEPDYTLKLPDPNITGLQLIFDRETPVNDKIKHVVVVVLGKPVDGLLGNEANQMYDGTIVQVRKSNKEINQFCPGHSMTDITEQIYGERGDAINKTVTMDGFAKNTEDHSWRWSVDYALDDVFGYHTADTLPVTYKLAQEYAIIDHYFCSVPGPTWPNRHFVHCATSNGLVDNDHEGPDGVKCKTMFRQLDEHNITWRIYDDNNDSPPFTWEYNDVRQDGYRQRLRPFEDIDPRENFNDNHPPANLTNGEIFIKRIYEALRNSSHWEESMMFITYDEHGGFYDHVPPPTNVPRPDNITTYPKYHDFHFTRLGVRVPAIAISPYTPKNKVFKSGYVNRHVEHSSIPGTLKNIFNLTGYLTKRDEWAEALIDSEMQDRLEIQPMLDETTSESKKSHSRWKYAKNAVIGFIAVCLVSIYYFSYGVENLESDYPGTPVDYNETIPDLKIPGLELVYDTETPINEKIKHVVLVVLGMPIDAMTGNETNRLYDGSKIQVQKTLKEVNSYDPGHSMDDITQQIYGARGNTEGKVPNMGGFARNVQDRTFFWNRREALDDVFGYRTEETLPISHKLAQEYAIIDHYFCSVPGPTWPNRHFIHCATSNGLVDNDHEGPDGVKCKTMFRQLDEHNITWRIYDDNNDSPPFTWEYNDVRQDGYRQRLRPFEDIDPRENFNDNHPPANLTNGEIFIKRIYEALRNSSHWEESMMFITYDEHGGFYDHVPPPTNVPRPDKIPTYPRYNDFRFTRLGVRVPAIVISPYTPKNKVFKSGYKNRHFEHSSIPGTLKRIFGLKGWLSKRDEWAVSFHPTFGLKEKPAVYKELQNTATMTIYEDIEMTDSNNFEELMQKRKFHKYGRWLVLAIGFSVMSLTIIFLYELSSRILKIHIS
ncbi:hypothetical protein HDV01_005985 [Terramyces sp. JEL0728]|nr:hypothetical protein HDV01_005985 [Terramyces sp. JEL0728]